MIHTYACIGSVGKAAAAPYHEYVTERPPSMQQLRQAYHALPHPSPLPARQRTFFRPGSKKGEQTLPSAKRWENHRSRVGPGSIGFCASGIWRSSRGHTEQGTGKGKKKRFQLSTHPRQIEGFLRPIKQAGKHAGLRAHSTHSTHGTRGPGEEGAGLSET